MRALALGMVVMLAAAAHADRASSQAHYKQGMAAYALEDWDGAIKEFQAGFRDDPTPPFLFNIAQAHRQAKRLDDAIRYYQRYLDLSPDARDRAEVEQLIRALQSSVDEQQRLLRAPPGASLHQPRAAPPAERHGRDWIGTGLAISGAAIVAVGIALAVYGAVADSQANDHSTHLDLGQRQDLLSRANVTGITGYVALGVGAGLLVGGIVKLALPAKAPATFSLGLQPGQLSVLVAGRF